MDESRLWQAENRAYEAEKRASAAEARASQAERRAKDAELRSSKAEERAASTVAEKSSGNSRWRDPSAISLIAVGYAVLCYTIVHVATSNFYVNLGIRPEDLRLGYPDLLEQASATAGGVAFIVLVAGAFGSVVFSFFLNGPLSESAGAAWRWLIALAIVVVVGFAVLRQVLPDVDHRTLALCALAYGLLVGSWFYHEPLVFITFLLSISLYAFFAVTQDLSETARLDVENGRVPRVRVLGESILPWTVSAATVHWKSSVPKGLRALDSTCVLEIAQTGDGTTVYMTNRTGGRRTVTIPDAEATVVVEPDRDACSWHERDVR